MIAVKYPDPEFRIRKEDGKDFVFDNIRKSWLMLTEEEWVRQNFVKYLVEVMKYPSTLIALEKEIMLGELKKRFDILVYNRDHQPWMLVECKSTGVALSEEVIQQVLRYNISVPVSFLVITNGHFTYAWERAAGGVVELNELPSIDSK